MIPLRCCIKKYDWGKRGMDSIVARIVKAQMPSYEVGPDEPFAEVSMLIFEHIPIEINPFIRYSFGWEHILLVQQW